MVDMNCTRFRDFFPLTMQFVFGLFLLEVFRVIFAIKTEIKFNLNVPSLFRCKRNGPLFRFPYFPSDQLFLQTIENSTKDCDLILLPAKKRVTFSLLRHQLGCLFVQFTVIKYVNEILYFQSHCLKNGDNDICLRLTPKLTTIITQSLSKTQQLTTIEKSITGIGTSEIQIGDDKLYPYSFEDHGFTIRGMRVYYVVFKMRSDEYLNMMCRYSYIHEPDAEDSVCRIEWVFLRKKMNYFQMRTGEMTNHGKGWSWLCYYYPSGVEQPLDYKMISRAHEEYEKASATTKPVVTTKTTHSNLQEFSNDSTTAGNETEKNSSKSLVSLVIMSVIVGGIICICKYKCQAKSKESDATRSSYESQTSVTSNDTIEDENY